MVRGGGPGGAVGGGGTSGGGGGAGGGGGRERPRLVQVRDQPALGGAGPQRVGADAERPEHVDHDHGAARRPGALHSAGVDDPQPDGPALDRHAATAAVAQRPLVDEPGGRGGLGGAAHGL